MKQSPDKAGYRPAEFAEACGFARSTFYALPPELRPRSVKVGTATIVIEQPRDYLTRLASLQDAAKAAV